MFHSYMMRACLLFLTHFRLSQDRRVENFLKENGFPGVNQRQRCGLALWPPHWLRAQERIYPIHLAARTGNHELVCLGTFFFAGNAFMNVYDVAIWWG